MASYVVNKAAVAYARKLIQARRYVLDSDWGESQPDAEAQNAFLAKHSWDDYASWHLGLTEDANDETKARYAFVFGDLSRVHRTALIACVYRASEWRHKDVELAAHRLLQLLDKDAGITKAGGKGDKKVSAKAGTAKAGGKGKTGGRGGRAGSARDPD